MRKLTFKGFLKQYTQSLSESNTLNFRTLADEIKKGNHRLFAPASLYAVLTGKVTLFANALKASGFDPKKVEFVSSLNDKTLEDDLSLRAENFPAEFHKVWNSYLVRVNRPQHERRIISASRERVLADQGNRKISTYRICKDLKLNIGNVNSWLKNGTNTVGYNTALRIFNYVCV